MSDTGGYTLLLKCWLANTTSVAKVGPLEWFATSYWLATHPFSDRAFRRFLVWSNWATTPWTKSRCFRAFQTRLRISSNSWLSSMWNSGWALSRHSNMHGSRVRWSWTRTSLKSRKPNKTWIKYKECNTKYIRMRFRWLITRCWRNTSSIFSINQLTSTLDLLKIG